MAQKENCIDLPYGYSLRISEIGFWWLHAPDGFGLARFHQLLPEATLSVETLAKAMNDAIEENHQIKAELKHLQTVSSAAVLADFGDRLANELERVAIFLDANGLDTIHIHSRIDQWKRDRIP